MRWDLFWAQEYDLPEGVGFPHFGAVHVASMLVLAVLLFLIVYRFRRLGAAKKERLLRGIPVGMLCMELFKDGYLICVGHFGIGYLPLHLCSFGILVFLLAAYLPEGRGREAFTEIAQVLILPGSAAAILMPDWNMYPVWSFMNLYSWFWHLLLVAWPVLAYEGRGVKPRLRHFAYPVLFLCAIVPPVYLLDRKLRCNYLFINWPPAGTPLVLFEKWLGNPGYLAGYAALVLAILLIVYGCWSRVSHGDRSGDSF